MSGPSRIAKMTPLNWSIAIVLTCASAPALAVPQQVVAAAGRWAALRGAAHCEAASLALLPASHMRSQGRASLSFDRRRHGQFAASLSRTSRAGSSVMLTIGDTPFLLVARGPLAWSRGPAQEQAIVAALRGGGAMRIEARVANGSRFIDRYSTEGSPTAIDAAAACATALPAGP